MKIKFLEEKIYDWITIEQLETIIANQFEEAIKTKWSRIIKIWRDKYISLDFYSDKKFLSCYVDLWNTYLRYDRTLQELLYIVKNDPYIKRNFKY